MVMLKSTLRSFFRSSATMDLNVRDDFYVDEEKHKRVLYPDIKFSVCIRFPKKEKEYFMEL